MQTLEHWVRHVCLRIVSLLFYFVTKNLHLATIFHHLVAKWQLNNFFSSATNSNWFRESYLFKFCFIIICEERKQKFLILNSCEKFIIFLANIRHVRFNMVNSKHRYCRCLLIKIYRPCRIVFTFHEHLSDEKLPEMKHTFLFFWNLKPLVTCNKINHKSA